MKAQLDASPAGITTSHNSVGLVGNDPAATARIGRVSEAAAVLLAISVSRITINVEINTSSRTEPNEACTTSSQIANPSPLALTAAARLRPPPNSNSTPQGSSDTRCQPSANRN